MRHKAGRTVVLLLAGLGVSLSLGITQQIACGQDNRSVLVSGDQKQSLDSIRKAVTRALPLLVKASSEEYPKHRECFSCHNQGVPAVALGLALGRGFDIQPETLRAIAEHTEADLAGAIEEYRKGQGQPGGVIRAGYALWALEAAGWAPDETTAGVAHYLSAVQSDRKRWPPKASRPPSESSSFTATALALRGMRSYGRAEAARHDESPNGKSRAECGDDRCAAGLGARVARENRAAGDRGPRLPALGAQVRRGIRPFACRRCARLGRKAAR